MEIIETVKPKPELACSNPTLSKGLKNPAISNGSSDFKKQK